MGGALAAAAAWRATSSGGPAYLRRMGTILSAAVVLMIYVMATRHRPILWDDIRRLSYFQATALVALLGLALWFQRRGALASARRRVLVSAALVVFSIASFLATPATKVIALGGALESSKAFNETIWLLIRQPSAEAALPPGMRPDVLDFAHFAQEFMPRETPASPARQPVGAR